MIMTSPKEGTEHESNGDYPQFRKSDDFRVEFGDGPWGYSPVFTTVWTGPFLASLGAFPSRSDLCLEARIWHPKGILPTSILRQEHARLLGNDPWLREVVCRIYLVDYKRDDGKFTYLIRIFVKLPKTRGESFDTSDLRPRPLIEANNVRVDFDRCPVVDCDGVRGHARGLVSKRLLERLDGTVRLRARGKVGFIKKPEIEFHIYPRIPSFKIPTDFQPPHLKGVNAECMEALKDIVFWNAKAAEHNYRNVCIPVRTTERCQPQGKPKRVANSTERRPQRLTFCDQVMVIFSDDDVQYSSPDGNLFAKVAPDCDNASVSTTTHLNDTGPDICTTSLDDTGVATVTPYDTQYIAPDHQDNSSVTPEIADTESDKDKLLVMSRGKRIRSFLARLFSCIPKCRSMSTE